MQLMLSWAQLLENIYNCSPFFLVSLAISSQLDCKLDIIKTIKYYYILCIATTLYTYLIGGPFKIKVPACPSPCFTPMIADNDI